MGGLRAPHNLTPHGGVEGGPCMPHSHCTPSLLALLGARPSSRAHRHVSHAQSTGPRQHLQQEATPEVRVAHTPPRPSALSRDVGPQHPGEARPQRAQEEPTRGAVSRAAGEGGVINVETEAQHAEEKAQRSQDPLREGRPRPGPVEGGRTSEEDGPVSRLTASVVPS